MHITLSNLRAVYTAIFCCLFTIGCTSKPDIHIYAKYLSDEQKATLERGFDNANYDIIFNNLDFPSSINQNTIIYSLLLSDPDVISLAERISDQNNLPVINTQALTKGNHWYTTNAIAVFLIPDNPAGQTDVFVEDLIQTYQGHKCPPKLTLTLKANGAYQFSHSTELAYGTMKLQGKWKYRQFPYIEFWAEGDTYASQYFEIRKSFEKDIVGEISFIDLFPANTGYFPAGCVFRHGVRT
ncbi:hypothetical protein DRW07_01170 [Alteromonas sediminis]|uniref:Uncharacterized protein n=1 Tax=Alteromonas sediminis TaxID=2259342 RepID=A0A3N5ZAE3_9ALTE|nr:hypothetical protein [Alteromonas sediminis]RPJ68054.1 hypothetical protein DRW07_01170 [Alteromonas sediminis]